MDDPDECRVCGRPTSNSDRLCDDCVADEEEDEEQDED